MIALDKDRILPEKPAYVSKCLTKEIVDYRRKPPSYQVPPDVLYIRQPDPAIPIKASLTASYREAAVNNTTLISDVTAFDDIADRLRKMQTNDEDMRPSEYAYAEAYALLAKVAVTWGADFPRAIVTVGEDRNIYVYWLYDDDSIELTVPSEPTELQSLNINIGSYSNFETRVSPELVYFWIGQLYQRK